MARKSLTTLKSEKAVAKGLQGMLMSDTQPETDKEGMTWFNKTNEITYIAVKNEAEVIEWKPMSGGTDTGGGTGGGASVTVSETAPADPSEGDLWMDSSSTQLYIYYNDGTTSQWVQTTATPTSAGASISVSSTPPALPTQGQVWWDSETANLYVAYNDGTGTQWIQSSSSPVTPVTDDATVGGTAPTDPVTGMLWYDTGTGELKVYDGTEWQVAGGGSSSTPALTISSVSPNNYDGDTGTEFTITGTNYQLGMTVDFITASGTEVRASVVTVLNQAQISVTTPQAFLSSDGPLDVKVNRPDGETVTLTDAIQTGGSPVWTTSAGTLYQNAWPADVTAGDNSYRLSMNVDESIAATDPDGQDVTYSVESGSLPTGVSLNSTTGAISGTLPSSLPGDQTYTFSAGASDTAGNLVTRNFSIIVKNSLGALYDFNGFTFTSGGTVGKTGPSPATLLNAYDTTSNPWLNISSHYAVTSWGRQNWQVPHDGTYRITITGARGSYQSSSYWHGLGAKLVVDLELTMGGTIYMVVGQTPGSFTGSAPYGAGGGGGGTFMYEPGQSDPILIAGGGGGGGGVTNAGGYVAANGGHPSYLDAHGQVDYSGLSASYGHQWEGDGAAGGCTASFNGNPGAGGSLGSGGQSGGSGWAQTENTGGGAGWLSNGQPNPNQTASNPNVRGKSLAGNFEGGTTYYTNGPNGGFGGGGASGYSGGLAGGGGGGGYSGGGGAGWASDLPGLSNASCWGGGGGSYITDNTGTVRNGRNASVVSMQEGQAGTADGCGLITIEPL